MHRLSLWGKELNGVLFPDELSAAFILASLVPHTFGTNTLKNQSVPDNAISGFFHCFFVQICFVWLRRVCDLFAFDAKYMVVQLCAQVIAVCPGHSYMADYPVLRQTIKVAIYRSMADFRVFCTDIRINPVCRRVVASCLYRLQHQSALPRFSSDHHIAVLHSG